MKKKKKNASLGDSARCHCCRAVGWDVEVEASYGLSLKALFCWPENPCDPLGTWVLWLT